MRGRSPTTWVFLGVTFGAIAFLALRSGHESGGVTPVASASAEPAALFALGDLRADPATLPVLGGLVMGSEVRDGFRVVGVTAVSNGRFGCLLDRRGEVAIAVWIERKRAEKPAPVQSSKYSLFWGDVHPGALPEPQILDVIKVIRDRIQASESTVPMPAGL